MKVSVLLTTYNHEKFIAEAINSVLVQEVNFDYEIIIIEDCSTDNTRDIVIDFQKRYQNKIRLVLEEKNKNDSRIWAEAIENSKSQYISLLDGDDYWTSPHKLQKQVDFLDNHPECSVCFHNVTTFYEDGSREPWNHNSNDQKEISSIEDLFERNFIAACSTMFRSGLTGKLPEWFFEMPFGDWPLHILNAQHGKIGYINEVMGRYRVHAGGAWSGLNEFQKLESLIKFYEIINAKLKFRYRKNIMPILEGYYRQLIGEYEGAGDFTKAKAHAARYFASYPINKWSKSREPFWILVRLYTPRLYNMVRHITGVLT
jgi:glycosyltransferase involved in cell wall biosynthesis